MDSVLVTKLSVSCVSQNLGFSFHGKREISWLVYISTQHLEWGRCVHTAGKTEKSTSELPLANAVKLMPQPARGFIWGTSSEPLLECLLRFLALHLVPDNPSTSHPPTPTRVALA